MEPQSPPERGHTARQTVVGTIVAVWALLDPLIGLVIVFLVAASLRPWLVFLVAAVALTAVNTALCGWLDRSWGEFAAGPGKKLESRLEKMRTGRIMRHPVNWITDGSSFWYAIAAMLTNAIQCVGIARIVGGKPIGERRVRLAAVSFSVFEAALFVLLGWALRDVLRS